MAKFITGVTVWDPEIGARVRVSLGSRVLVTVPEGSPYAGQEFSHGQPLPLSPETANFEALSDRLRLASLGIHPVDRKAHRDNRNKQAAIDLYLQGAYLWLGRYRADEHAALCQQVGKTEGIWATSSGEHARLCYGLDALVVSEAVGLGYGECVDFAQGYVRELA